MLHLRNLGALLMIWLIAALGVYELTAKSPRLLGSPLPGWPLTERVERTVGWTRPTGVLPLDKLWHETREAARYYALLSRPRPEDGSR